MASYALEMGTPTSPKAQNPFMFGDDDKDSTVEVRLRTENQQPRALPRGSIYHVISWILGFKEKYSLLHFIVWGGALLGFCLARSIAMNPARTAGLLPPGEWFWLGREQRYRVNLFLHIYLATFGGLGAMFQFLPAIRRRKMILHRSNGYGVLGCLIVGNICGAIVARRSFGGELNVQAAYYTLGLVIVASGSFGYYYVKRDTRRHRKWMMRMVAYFGSAISARLIMFAAARIITTIGTYYSIWRCDEVINLLGNSTALQTSYPRCVAPGVNAASTWVAVHASTVDGALYHASALRATHGMGLWIALLTHVVAVEFYIQETNSRNQVRINYALEPVNLEEELPQTARC